MQNGPAMTTEGGMTSRAVRRVEAFFFAYRDQLRWVHMTMFVVFLGIIILPLFLPEPPESATPWNNYTKFANYLLWGLWFPLVFLSVIFTGRSWCGGLCPMGAAAEWSNGVGLQRAIPRWLRWDGAPIVSFLIITVLGQTTGVRDHPEAAAEIFGGTMLAAVAIGFVFGRRKRAWCRHACPIGLLLGVFSRLGAVDFVPKVRLPGGEGYTEKGVCPTMIDTTRKTESRHCIECFRCVNPKAKGSVELRVRMPGAEIESIRNHHPNAAEVWFLFMGTGIALGGFLWLVLPLYEELRQTAGEWALAQGFDWIGNPGPAWLMSHHPERREVFVWLDFLMISGFMIGFMALLTAVLTATTALCAWLAGRCGAAARFGQRFVELGYQTTPVAMVSLLLGLGGALFDPLKGFVGAEGVGAAKGLLMLLSLAWSLRLGWRILANQGVAAGLRWMPMSAGMIGSLVTCLAWWPAVVGL